MAIDIRYRRIRQTALAGIFACGLVWCGAARGDWPVLKTYEGASLEWLKMPLGGIGTGTVSLSGRGALVDWELGGAPNKGFTPRFGNWAPHFAVRVETAEGRKVARILEGPVPHSEYEGPQGATGQGAGFPHVDAVVFRAAYPLATLTFRDAGLPLAVTLEAMNPLVPHDADASGIPAALFRWRVRSLADGPLKVSLAVTLVRMDGVEFALVLPDGLGTVTEATSIRCPGWNVSLERYWERFEAEGVVGDLGADERLPVPARQKCVAFGLRPGETKEIPFALGWRKETRRLWDARNERLGTQDGVNYYATKFPTAETAARRLLDSLPALEAKTVAFVRSVLAADAPDVVKEAALFNLSTLRTETCFRLSDGNFYGWEGCGETVGLCPGNCTHVWGYEHALVDLWPELARRMLDVFFGPAMDERGLVMYRVGLPLETEARASDLAAADGQMNGIVKAHEYWRKTRDDAWLRHAWPRILKAIAAAWLPRGWDADRDGVMEGCQHNTMDVEYFGPNPQIQFLYLAALEAGAAMADAVGDAAFARDCRALSARGKAWTEANLFNGEYYEQKVMPAARIEDVLPSLIQPKRRARFKADPDFQLGKGCLIDQLLGDFSARAAGLAPVADRAHAQTALKAVLRRNRKGKGEKRFNPMRSFAMDDEESLVMAWYPAGTRPKAAFPYCRESMTGFEYVVAALLAWDGDRVEAERVVRNVRDRYDGRRRNPFDEAEYGHHYVRALASWSVFRAFAGESAP